MAPQKGDMPFWDHLEVLRRSLFKALGLTAALAATFFVFMPVLVDKFVFAPCKPDFPLYQLFDAIAQRSPLLGDAMTTPADFSVDIINIKLASQFLLHMSLSFWMAVVAAFPGLLYIVWQFIEPALMPNERRGVSMAFTLGTVMFYLGVAVGYLLVFPLTLRFLATYSLSSEIHNQLSLDSYIDNFLMLNLLMGLIFELPLIAWLLGRLGILTKSFFSRYRRHAIVALLLLAAVITPTGDPFTLAVVFIPIYLLWEGSASLVPNEHTATDKQPIKTNPQ